MHWELPGMVLKADDRWGGQKTIWRLHHGCYFYETIIGSRSTLRSPDSSLESKDEGIYLY